MKISVIGCGYLGAVHAACMASLGHDVVGVDTDATKIAALSAGHSPFYEPGFEDVLRTPWPADGCVLSQHQQRMNLLMWMCISLRWAPHNPLTAVPLI